MKKVLRFTIIASFILPVAAKAQFETFKDSVVQLYGVVMTADSLKAVPYASIIVKGQNRGTLANDQGVFSIVVLKGDNIEFTAVGYRPKLVSIPRDLKGNQFSMIQLMVEDTFYLPATIIKARPSREQFERDFVNAKVPDDQMEVARKNNNAANRRALMSVLPRDGKEATNYYLKQQAAKTYYQGQIAPMNIFNPAAWSEFINAWKRGDFRNK
jgi:hypothetical protein